MNTSELKVKIFTSYLQPWDIIENDIITPIQCGRATADVKLPMIGDDTGDNISEKNYMYGELTAQYWAWKNDSDYDYIGFMDHRRHFNFGKTQTTHEAFSDYHNDKMDETKIFIQNYITDSYLNSIAIDEDNIKQSLNGCDVLLPFAENLSSNSKNSKDETNKDSLELYSEIVKEKMLRQIIQDLYPDYATAFDEYLEDNLFYSKRMFIMKKSVFMKYSEFLFSILTSLEKQVDNTDIAINNIQYIAFIGDLLLGVFIYKNKEAFKTKELQQSSILESFTLNYTLTTLDFNKEDVNICLAFSTNYIGYSYVAIKSLLMNRKTNYNINIFCFIDFPQGKSTQYKYLEDLEKQYSNVKIVIINVTKFLLDKNIKFKVPPSSNHTISSYIRLFIPIILPKLERVVYLDSDLIVNTDIQELYNYDLQDKYVGAVRDLGISIEKSPWDLDVYDTKKKRFITYNITNYVEEYLEINYKEYINTGVLLMDYTKLKEDGIIKNSLDIIQKRYFTLLDQDTYNIVFNKKINYLPQYWNATEPTTIALIPDIKDIFDGAVPYKMYKENFIDEHKIIHYTGSVKPWIAVDLNVKELNIWWEVAKTTPFYECFLQQCIVKSAGVRNRFNLLFTVKRYLLTKHPIIAKILKLPYHLLRRMYRTLKYLKNFK